MATPAIAGFVVNMLNYKNSLTQGQIVDILSNSSASTPISTNGGNVPGVSANCDTIKNLIDNYVQGMMTLKIAYNKATNQASRLEKKCRSHKTLVFKACGTVFTLVRKIS